MQAITTPLFVTFVLVTSPASAQSTLRASVDSAGGQASSQSHAAAPSADGRIVAFHAYANDLVPGDTNSDLDVFVHDFDTGQTERVSISTAGTQANGSSTDASLSGDGRYVAFTSSATNLVTGDVNGWNDVFVRDRQTQTTFRASVSALGGEANGASLGPAFSADGNYLTFLTSATNLVPGGTSGWEVLVRDMTTGSVARVSVAQGGGFPDGPCAEPSLSADGSLVVFSSVATNLVPNDTNAAQDLFVRDRLAGVTTRVNVTSSGAQTSGPGGAQTLGGRLSGDGRLVVYWSDAGNIVPGDSNGYSDVFLHDRVTGETTRISTDAFGTQANFPSRNPTISADGRFVAFQSWATNLIPGDTNASYDAFVRDRFTPSLARVSVDSSGQESNGHTYEPAISADGTHVVFESDASNLVAADTNGTYDVFRHGPVDFGPPIVAFCTAKTNSQGCLPQAGWSGAPSATSPTAFDLTATNVLNNRPGLLFYGYGTLAGVPFQGGTLCVQPPLRRTAVQTSGGSPPPAVDCSGQYGFDFNALIQGGTDPFLVPGQEGAAQFWSRDPAHPDGTGAGVTDGVRFLVGN